MIHNHGQYCLESICTFYAYRPTMTYSDSSATQRLITVPLRALGQRIHNNGSMESTINKYTVNGQNNYGIDKFLRQNDILLYCHVYS